MFVVEMDLDKIIGEIPEELLNKIKNGKNGDIKEIIKKVFNKEECDCQACRAEREGLKKENIMSFEEFVKKILKPESKEEKEEKTKEEVKEEKATEKKDKKFWLVWRPTGNAPRKRHASHEEALIEAKRLATANPNSKFYVLEATDEIETTVKIESNKL